MASAATTSSGTANNTSSNAVPTGALSRNNSVLTALTSLRPKPHEASRAAKSASATATVIATAVTGRTENAPTRPAAARQSRKASLGPRVSALPKASADGLFERILVDTFQHMEGSGFKDDVTLVVVKRCQSIPEVAP